MKNTVRERAFTSREVLNYDVRVEHHVDKFVHVLRRTARNDVDVVKAVLSSLRNIGEILAYLPASPQMRVFQQWGSDLVTERRRNKAARKDLFHHFLHNGVDANIECTPEEMTANANLAMTAGTDTIPTPTAQTLRLLAKDPHVQAKLGAELDTICSAGVALTVETTRTLPYLNAVINEGLRLGYPAPSGIQAMTAPGGIQVGDTYIPGNVEVKVPSLLLMTDPRYFPMGECFIPERWTGEMPELIRDRRAYIPFGYGAHSCVGKQLALNEMRVVVARAVHEFNISLGEHYDDDEFLEKRKDFLAVQLSPLYLKFSPRR
ncbi:cytochrome P450 [Aspergillus sclerotiicarbonarius CBS 121057]|uniref:Cytochrome P450 n=1 Tax=Aspergillus sclerotiicarbonarius (strain CBS 121057 / IBT 28362) TaxID=1448318 RepID=A0A319DY66_ASPSB|nr:cytochrome P450 [Aspergillus sclerotiicarbonarius CBS 121057]